MSDFIRIKVDTRDVERALQQLGRKAPAALADALTKAAYSARKAVQGEMKTVFDRPTPFTLNSMYVSRATPTRLEAKVDFKDLEAKSVATNRSHYLTVETFGGVRPLKQFEAALQRVGAMPEGWRAVPGPGAELDSFGNMKRGQITQIMSWLGAFKEVGFQANITDKSRKRAMKGTRSRRGFAYFAVTGRDPRTRHLAPGVYRKTRTAWGWAIKPIVLFVPGARYARRLKFFEVGTAAGQRSLQTTLDNLLRRLAS